MSKETEVIEWDDVEYAFETIELFIKQEGWGITVLTWLIQLKRAISEKR